MARARLGALPLCVVLLGSPSCTCARGAAPEKADAGPEAPSHLEPEPQARVPTTDGTIAVGNLNAQIRAASSAIQRTPKHAGTKHLLLDLLTTRAAYLGVLADLERADALAEELVRDEPKDPRSYLARADTRARFHRFDDALADLAEAERRAPGLADIGPARASILEGRGDPEGALAIQQKAREAHPTLGTMGLEAVLLGEIGRRDEASQLFRAAVASHRDVSPFPIAWLFFQEGLMWERAGNADRARAFYRAAHDRLPGYAHAASHLARLEPADRAIALLLPVVATADDPEFELVLSQMLRKRGDAEGADARVTRVRARYEELLQKHPAAFAEHAGWFFLDEGKDPKRALDLAKQDLAIRRTAKGYELALLAAIAAGARDEACALGAGVAKLPSPPEMLRSLAADACKKR